MTATWLRMRSELRSSLRAVLLILVLVAIGGGCVLVALAGARRTQTAVRRFVAYNKPEDLSLFFDPTPQVAARVLALPEIARTTRMPYLMVSTDPSRLAKTGVFGATDDRGLRSIDRPMVLHGRLAAPDRPGEAVITDLAAQQAGLHVGSRVTLYAFSRAQIDAVSRNGFLESMRPEGPRFSVRVVGVVRQPNDVAVVPIHQGDLYDSTGSLITTPAFVQQYARTLGMRVDELPGNEIARVQLRHGASDLRAFTADVDRIARGHVQILPGSDARATAAAVQRGTSVEAVALMSFAVLAAIATFVLIGLNLGRLIRTDARDYAQLRALGMTRSQLISVALARPVVIVLGGGALAVALAIAASPLTPIGLARQAELHRGVAVNVAVLGAGVAVLVFVLIGCAFLVALNATRSPASSRQVAGSRRGTAATERVGRLGLGPALALGVGHAWSKESSSTRRVGIVAIALATAAVVGAATFDASLGRLIASPKQQGWTFDVVVGNTNDQSDQVARDAPILERNPYVGSFSAIATPPETPTIDGHSIGLVGVDERKGSVGPFMLDGRFARAPNEIVLGRRSLRALHKHIGDTVEVAAGPQRASMRITGTMLGLSAGSVFNGRLDEGGTVTLATLKRLEPGVFVTVFFVTYAPGVDRRAALASIKRDFGTVVLQRTPAQDVQDLARVDALPGLLAALLVLLAIATLAHNLLASVRRRRRTLATLKVIGLERPQLAAAVLWQMWALAIVGVVVGVPLGVLLGRWAWRFVATQIGSVQPPAVPVAIVGISVLIAVIITTLVAIVPAVTAARVRPATALRQE